MKAVNRHRPCFWFSCCSLVWFDENCFTSLWFSFPTCEMGNYNEIWALLTKKVHQDVQARAGEQQHPIQQEGDCSWGRCSSLENIPSFFFYLGEFYLSHCVFSVGQASKKRAVISVRFKKINTIHIHCWEMRSLPRAELWILTVPLPSPVLLCAFLTKTLKFSLK